MNLLRKIFLLLIITMLVIPAFSEESEDTGFDFGMVMEIGAESIIENGDTVSYQMLSINPEFAIGK